MYPNPTAKTASRCDRSEFSVRGVRMTKTYIFSVVMAVLSLLTLIILIKKNKSLPKSVKNSFYFASALIVACTATEFAKNSEK